MDFLITIFYVFLFTLIIRNHRFFRIDGVRKEAIRFAFFLKLFAGGVLFLVYTYYYTDRSTADIFKYFDDGKIMANAFYNKPLDFFKMLFSVQNDTPYFTETYYNQMNNWFRVYDSNIFSDSHLIIRFNAFVMLFSFGVYHVHTVVVCFLSFIGITALYKFLIEYMPKAKLGLYLALYLIPSVVFWSSGVLKEGLIFFALGMLIYHSNNFFEKFSFWKVATIIFSIALLLYTKIYVFLIIFPLMVIFKSLKPFNRRNIGLIYLGSLSLFFICSMMILKSLVDIDLLQMLAQKQHDFILLAKIQNPGSFIVTNELQPNLLSFIQYLPVAFSNTFLRPIIGLDNSPIMIPSIIENLIFWTLLILSFVFPSKRTKEQSLLFYFLFWFVVGIFLLTGFTAPILGAIVRYKSIALPFLGAIFCLLISKKKLFCASKRVAAFGIKLEHRILYKSIIP